MTTETKTYAMTAAPGSGSGIWHVVYGTGSAQCQADRPSVRGHITLRTEHTLTVEFERGGLGILYDALIAAGHRPCERCFRSVIKNRK